MRKGNRYLQAEVDHGPEEAFIVSYGDVQPGPPVGCCHAGAAAARTVVPPPATQPAQPPRFKVAPAADLLQSTSYQHHHHQQQQGGYHSNLLPVLQDLHQLTQFPPPSQDAAQAAARPAAPEPHPLPAAAAAVATAALLAADARVSELGVGDPEEHTAGPAAAAAGTQSGITAQQVAAGAAAAAQRQALLGLIGSAPHQPISNSSSSTGTAGKGRAQLQDKAHSSSLPRKTTTKRSVGSILYSTSLPAKKQARFSVRDDSLPPPAAAAPSALTQGRSAAAAGAVGGGGLCSQPAPVVPAQQGGGLAALLSRPAQSQQQHQHQHQQQQHQLNHSPHNFQATPANAALPQAAAVDAPVPHTPTGATHATAAATPGMLLAAAAAGGNQAAAHTASGPPPQPAAAAAAAAESTRGPNAGHHSSSGTAPGRPALQQLLGLAPSSSLHTPAPCLRAPSTLGRSRRPEGLYSSAPGGASGAAGSVWGVRDEGRCEIPAPCFTPEASAARRSTTTPASGLQQVTTAAAGGEAAAAAGNTLQVMSAQKQLQQQLLATLPAPAAGSGPVWSSRRGGGAAAGLAGRLQQLLQQQSRRDMGPMSQAGPYTMGVDTGGTSLQLVLVSHSREAHLVKATCSRQLNGQGEQLVVMVPSKAMGCDPVPGDRVVVTPPWYEVAMPLGTVVLGSGMISGWSAGL